MEIENPDDYAKFKALVRDLDELIALAEVRGKRVVSVKKIAAVLSNLGLKASGSGRVIRD